MLFLHDSEHELGEMFPFTPNNLEAHVAQNIYLALRLLVETVKTLRHRSTKALRSSSGRLACCLRARLAAEPEIEEASAPPSQMTRRHTSGRPTGHRTDA